MDVDKAINNAIASARMEGFDFTEEQISLITNLARQVESGDITWDKAIQLILKKYKNFSKNT